ncbi:hypothetical protein EG329_011391 [Mollisiaceae sp. DMI_Dod_QoI]|nr:hypothetical protein EG329_011391 [Helotiales sp. DMI_Dod_QoI]
MMEFGSPTNLVDSRYSIASPLQTTLDYEPAVHWFDGGQPAHPLFDQHHTIQSITSQIKNKLLEYALEGFTLLIHESSISVSETVLRSLESHPEISKSVLATQNYGGIYLASRSDAREWTGKWREQDSTISLIHEIDALLRMDNMGIRALNYGVHAFVNDPEMKIDREQRLIPYNAICCKGENHIAVNKKCFLLSAENSLGHRDFLYDLHDFAHLTTATLCSELYGNQYHPHLAALPPPLTALIRSPNINLKQGKLAGTPLASDGIIFSEFLTRLFNDEWRAAMTELDSEKGLPKRTYGDLTARLAWSVAEYLMGRRSLTHNTTGELVTLENPITPVELAVLAQNKAYELTSSEMEQRVFFRGRVKAEDPKDDLEDLNAWERMNWLAKNKSWTYFEARNTVKHRAQKEAYRLVAEEFLALGEEKALCQMILDNIVYEDWKRGQRVNLWDLVACSISCKV